MILLVFAVFTLYTHSNALTLCTLFSLCTLYLFYIFSLTQPRPPPLTPTLSHSPADRTHSGMVNKVFFSDVPTLKATKSDVVIDKKKLAAAAKAREAEMLEMKEKDRLKNQQAVLANSGTRTQTDSFSLSVTTVLEQ